MKLLFETIDLELFGDGENVLTALGQIEEKLKAITGTEEVLIGDTSIDFEDMIAVLVSGDTFYRNCFSTPETNFSIEVI